MIPAADVTAWREQAPWVDDVQVEQDLVIARALVEIFQRKTLADRLAFRMATKLRALYQRSKARDLFDLWKAIEVLGVDAARVVEAFLRYTANAGTRISRAEFEANLAAKLEDPEFPREVDPLLTPGTTWDVRTAAAVVQREIIARLPGLPWKGTKPGLRQR